MDADCRAALIKRVSGLNMREKRDVFACMRKASDWRSLFFPQHGFTAGEFAVAYVIQLPVKLSQKHASRQSA